MNINLKQFNAFLLVAECGSLRAAAQRANRSLPAISMQVHHLEEQLGTPLFQRRGKQLALTDAGQHLLAFTRRAFQELDAGLRQLQQTINLEQGHVSLACSPSLATSLLPAILSTFSQRYPGIRLHLRELSLQEQVDSLKSQAVDFSVGPQPDDMDPSMAFEPVMHDEILAVLPGNHPLASKSSMTLRAFTRMPILILSRDAGFRRTFDTVLGAAGIAPSQIRCEAKQISTLIAMVRAGMGAALLPRVALRDLAGDDRHALAVLRVTRPTLTRELGILTLRRARLAPAAKLLCDTIRGSLRQIDGAGVPLKRTTASDLRNRPGVD